MTPAEHIEQAESLLAEADKRRNPTMCDMNVMIALANAHVTVALAKNAIPVMEESAAILREGREEEELDPLFRAMRRSPRRELS